MSADPDNIAHLLFHPTCRRTMSELGPMTLGELDAFMTAYVEHLPHGERQ